MHNHSKVKRSCGHDNEDLLRGQVRSVRSALCSLHMVHKFLCLLLPITGIMSSICVERLPKVLVLALAELIDEQRLIQWNIYSNGNNVNVTMKFTVGECGQSSMSHPMKGKSPSQTLRDNEISMLWHESTPMAVEHNYDHTSYGSPGAELSQSMQVGHLPSQDINLRAGALSYVPTTVSNSGQISEAELTQVKLRSDPNECETDPNSGEICDSKHDPYCTSVTDVTPNQRFEDLCPTTGKESSEDFVKIVCDHRTILPYNAIRGTTKDNKIVSFEIGKETDFFHVMEKTDENSFEFTGYELWIKSFADIRHQSMWSNEMNEMLKHWNNYVKEKT